MLPDFFLQLILPNHCNCLISGSRPGFLEFLWLGQAGYNIYFTLSLKLSQILTLHFFSPKGLFVLCRELLYNLDKVLCNEIGCILVCLSSFCRNVLDCIFYCYHANCFLNTVVYCCDIYFQC